MSRFHYIKEVVGIIEDRSYIDEFGKLGEVLAEKGIWNCWYGIQEGVEGIVDKHGKALWITDSHRWAVELAGLNVPLLIFMHPGNRGKDFSMAKYGMECPEDMNVEYLDNIYRRFAGIPWDILETERCLIRETTEEDVPFFYQIYSEPSIVEYMDGLYPAIEEEIEYVREYIEKVYSFYNFGVWTVVLKDTGEVIGRAGICFREGYDEPELGFIIGVPWQGRGIAYEICNAIMDHAREELGFEKVQTLVEPGNIASLKLCRKLGFGEAERVVEKGKEYIRMEIHAKV